MYFQIVVIFSIYIYIVNNYCGSNKYKVVKNRSDTVWRDMLEITEITENQCGGFFINLPYPKELVIFNKGHSKEL